MWSILVSKLGIVLWNKFHFQMKYWTYAKCSIWFGLAKHCISKPNLDQTSTNYSLFAIAMYRWIFMYFSLWNMTHTQNSTKITAINKSKLVLLRFYFHFVLKEAEYIALVYCTVQCMQMSNLFKWTGKFSQFLNVRRTNLLHKCGLPFTFGSTNE